MRFHKRSFQFTAYCSLTTHYHYLSVAQKFFLVIYYPFPYVYHSFLLSSYTPPFCSIHICSNNTCLIIFFRFLCLRNIRDFFAGSVFRTKLICPIHLHTIFFFHLNIQVHMLPELLFPSDFLVSPALIISMNYHFRDSFTSNANI